MPTLITFLVGALVSAVGHIVAKVLLSLGFGYITYTGFTTVIDLAKDEFALAMSALPPVALQLAGVLQVGTAFNILVSAYLSRLVVSGLLGNDITRLVNKA